MKAPARRTHLTEQLWERAVELLGDGQWHNYEQVITELGKLVPPGVAMRKSERERIGEGRSQRGGKKGAPQRVRPRPIDKQIESGKRSIVRIFLKNRVFEKDRHGHPRQRIPDRQIRMVLPQGSQGKERS